MPCFRSLDERCSSFRGNRHTHTHTETQLTTVILAAHAHRGLMISISVTSLHMQLPLQWNLPKEDTSGTRSFVLYIEVSLFQRWICTDRAHLGHYAVSLLERCPYFRGVLSERFHCIHLVSRASPSSQTGSRD